MIEKMMSNLKKDLKINTQLKEEEKKIREEFGLKFPLIIAGPCSIESKEMILTIAEELNKNKITAIRGGAYKPRTSPYDFQGLKKEGIAFLKESAEKYNLLTVSEILDVRDLDFFIENIDIIQVGSRNMYNYPLLEELGKTDKYILLKRGFSATLKEWLMASEYILKGGNRKIIFCERGIRTYSDYTRNTLDLSIIPLIKELTVFPVIVDPSHASGYRKLVTPLSRASLSIGADGLLIEVHPNPDEALSDGEQTLDFKEFSLLISYI